ncbi:MAG TPA: TIGR03643 family protein [Bacteroidales bacterium]|nr:TIGR03643 family protein [Bacteroidales bacterium]
MIKMKAELSDREVDRIIELAWEDRTPFEAIEFQFGPSEKEVINLMRNRLKQLCENQFYQ